MVIVFGRFAGDLFLTFEAELRVHLLDDSKFFALLLLIASDELQAMFDYAIDKIKGCQVVGRVHKLKFFALLRLL